MEILPAFTRAEAAGYRAELVAFERALGGPLTALERKWRSRTFLLFGWAQKLVRHPAILDAIERAEYDVWSKRPEVSKWEKVKLLLGAVARHAVTCRR